MLGDTFLKLTGALSADPDDIITDKTKQVICQAWPYPLTNAASGESSLEALQRENECGFPRAVFELNRHLVRRQLGLE